eukprot:TRINITY_DN4507_c0_g1_i1.p1 TRINITY_DN4507_c0_g1~~TRINITY_DN4507_c0_g1_i1.p1  ORF type:complete len:381 (-),score=97.52 TRINITY_DN4507_c0_g1_i1:200-1312(-)
MSSQDSENAQQNSKNWVSCPYNPEHRMPPTRLQWHLVKCPDKKYYGEQYATCPYNATHKILKSDLADHQRRCPDKKRVGTFVEEDEIDKQMRAYLASGAHKSQVANNQSTWEQEMKPQGPVGWFEETETKPKGRGKGRGAGRGQTTTPSYPPTEESYAPSEVWDSSNRSWETATNSSNSTWESNPSDSGWETTTSNTSWETSSSSIQQTSTPTKSTPQKSLPLTETPKAGPGGAGKGRGRGEPPKSQESRTPAQVPSFNSGYTSRHNEDFLIQKETSEPSEWQVVTKGKPGKPTNQSQIPRQDNGVGVQKPTTESLTPEAIEKRKKILRKKIKEIEDLQKKQAEGETLDQLQLGKISKKKDFLRELASYK